MFRTPAKEGNRAEDNFNDIAAGTATVTKQAGPRPNVRRSVGDVESGSQGAFNRLTPPRSPMVASPKTKLAVVRRLSVESAENPPTKTQGSKSSDRVAEARACVRTAKLHLSISKNLRTDIKVAVTQAIDCLFRLVKEADAAKGQKNPSPVDRTVKEGKGKDVVRMGEGASSSSSPGLGLEGMMKKHMELIAVNTAKVTTLTEALDQRTVTGGLDDVQADNIGRLLGEVRELRQTTEETGKRVSSFQETLPSYAEVLALPKRTVSPTKSRPNHSIIVSSHNEMDTSDEVLGKVREALEAKTTGLQVTRVQKVRNQKVVLSCASKAELLKVTERISKTTKGLNVEEAKNKDPLVIIKNLLTFNKDAEIVSSLRSQNKNLLGDLGDDEFRATVKYRRRARNPHENHVVLQVSPKLWLKLTEAGRVHVDLQYAAVQDQSPLVQCTRCLGYGHGRRLCTESADLCSHCAGPHLRADCPVHAAGGTATCRNCGIAKYPNVGHNAFDGECPVRKRWDAIARSSVAYC